MSAASILPASLNLPAHLSAHKYFFVCTLTVAAWDTLVLSPRTWRLWRTAHWPALKILYHALRLLMPTEFIIVGVAFFDTHFTQAACRKFYLFEPICTAVLLAMCSAIHVIRLYGIYDKNRSVLFGMGGLFAAQVIVTAVSCAFYRSVPLLEGQGCIAGPKHNWVGIYWVMPTVLYTASLTLAVLRTKQSMQSKSSSLWHVMLRDNLNIYASIWAVNMVNMLFWFIAKPTGPADSIKTIVTSMAAVLTTTMSMRIVLGVRGSLASGGTFSGSYASSHTANTSRSGGVSGATRSPTASHAHSAAARGTTHIISTPRSPQQQEKGTFAVDVSRAQKEVVTPWETDKSSDDGKAAPLESDAADINVVGYAK